MTNFLTTRLFLNQVLCKHFNLMVSYNTVNNDAVCSMVAIILCDIVINKYTKQTTFCNFAIYSSSYLYIWQTQSKTDCICPIAVHSYKHKYIQYRDRRSYLHHDG